jgi:hypothetical protein
MPKGVRLAHAIATHFLQKADFMKQLFLQLRDVGYIARLPVDFW